jgi:hypothetical protein
MVEHDLREQILIVTFAGVKAAERPEMAEVQSGKDAAVAKIAIGQDLWKEPVNQYIQLDCRHDGSPSDGWASSPRKLLIIEQEEDNSAVILAYSEPLSSAYFSIFVHENSLSRSRIKLARSGPQRARKALLGAPVSPQLS